MHSKKISRPIPPRRMPIKTYHFREVALRTKEAAENVMLRSGRIFNIILRRVSEGSLLDTGYNRAQLAACRAYRRVPAYQKFLAKNGIQSFSDLRWHAFETLPETDKQSYAKAYSFAERCLDGQFLRRGISIDETSGTSGHPFNWIRGTSERQRLFAQGVRSIDYLCGPKPNFAINAFLNGPYATAMHLGQTFERHGIAKNTGPNIDMILRTLKSFGENFRYLVLGYPPFLKLLLDRMRDENFPLSRFEIHGIVGGEGHTEEYRDYLLRNGLRSLYSGYGAADLSIAAAVETPESVAIRRALHQSAELRGLLLGEESRPLPMVFQYNPAVHYFEENPAGQLLDTMLYSKTLMPRVRYNVGDEGRIILRKVLLDAVRRVVPNALSQATHPPVDFPYLMLFGRADSTVSIMGANIYPEFVERALMMVPEISQGFAAFNLDLINDDHGVLTPRVGIEWATASPPQFDLAILARQVGDNLASIFPEYQTQRALNPDIMQLTLEIHGFNTGPFAIQRQRVKNKFSTSLPKGTRP